jgi:hippurate hydrolase
MHNMPGLATGHFALRPGPLLAAADRFDIELEGKGAHAAKAYEGVDTIVVAAQVITALQSIVSRNVDALKSGVVSVTYVRGGDAYNIIPQTVTLRGTVRTLDAGVRDLIEERIKNVAEHTAAVFGARAKVDYHRGYPITFNHEAETGYAASAAKDIAGDANVMTDIPPSMGGEDFSYMLLERPGAMILVGNGDTAGLHHPAYDFNDEAIAAGVSYWARLAEKRMPA